MGRTNVAVLGAALALMSSAGCVPAVTHSPRVDAGAAMEFAAALPASARQNTPGFPSLVLPPSSIMVAGGWRSDATDFAARFAAGVSSPFELDLDAYVQLPRHALLGLDGGVGIVALAPSFASTAPMPYAELGFIRSGSGPYLVAGYFHQPIDTNAVEGPEVLHADGWEATLAYQFTSGNHSMRPFATALIGRRYALHCFGKASDCSTYAPPRALFIGMSLERRIP